MPTVYGLKPRFQTLLRPLVRQLAHWGITANHVTVTALLFSFAVGLTVVRFPTARLPLLLMPLAIFGLGKALPKGEAILVPFFCDVFIGEPMAWTGDRRGYMRQLDERMKQLAAEGNFPSWD